MRHLRALMSNVAHDLKAPVACIVAGRHTLSTHPLNTPSQVSTTLIHILSIQVLSPHS